MNEGGLFSGSREYLRVKRQEHVFDVCGAPFGRAFFVSWWLTEQQGCLRSLPLIGELIASFKPPTFYSIDTSLMFRSAVHAAVLETVHEITKAKGRWSLSPEEEKPILRDFFRR